MKLEIKHLAPYLPYGLKIKSMNDIIYTLCDKGGLSNLAIADLIDNPELYKPILRPLSDLTKEIEVNGEKFVPCEELLKTKFKQHYNSETISRYKEICYNSRTVWFQNIANYNMDIPNKINVSEQPYWVAQYLLELHFDIFGLIDNNLAININDNR